jgi:hypothetical protein
VKAPAAVNKHNLSQDWFDRMRDNAPSEMHYDAGDTKHQAKENNQWILPFWIQRNITIRL